MEEALRLYPVRKKAEEDDALKERQRKINNLPIEAVLDLHGLYKEEAKKELRAFLARSSAKGIEMVLIVHGKGLHSKNPILKDLTREELSGSPYVRKFGSAKLKHGGSGASWAVLR